MINETSDRQPEQTFFDDPALDVAVAMIMTLATELHVTRDRLRALEVLLERKGILDVDALDNYEPDEDEAGRVALDREAFVRSLLSVIKQRQVSKGAPDNVVDRFAD